MDKSIRYVNSRGEEVRLAWDEQWHYTGTDLFDASVGVEESNDRVAGFIRGASERTLTAALKCRPEDGVAERNRLMDVAHYDLAVGRPGRIYAGASWASAYVTDAKWAGWWHDAGEAEVELTVLLTESTWVREHVVDVMRDVARVRGGLDYPHGYPHDYTWPSGAGNSITNPFATPARAEITVPGYAASPYVVIAGNRYQVNAQVDDGSLLTVSPIDRTVTLRDRFGGVENVFDRALRGPGQYIFEPIPPGESTIVWPGGYNILIRMLEERWSPAWT